MIKQVAANRDELYQRLTNFLTPEQLKKWDAEVGKAKDSLTNRWLKWRITSRPHCNELSQRV